MSKRKVRKSKNKVRSAARKSRKKQIGEYQQLEARQMLATDIGLQFSGATFGTESTSVTTNVQGDIGYEHYVEVTEGAFIVHDRDTGVRVQTNTLDEFFVNAGASVNNGTFHPQIIFDHQSERWFAAANGGNNGNYIYIAISNTSDPTGIWESSQFIGDSQGITINQDVLLSVDKDAVYLGTNNFGQFGNSSSLYSIPKSDLFLANPTITNMSRFEALTDWGSSIQVAINFEDSDGKATVISSAGPGSIFVGDIFGASGPGATLSPPTNIYAAVNIPTPLDQPLETTQPSLDDPAGVAITVADDLSSSIYEWRGSIFGAMTVTTDFDDVPGELDDGSGDFQQGVLWFEVDVNSTPKMVVEQDRGPNAHVIFSNNSDTFRQTFFNPSIAVTQYGVLSIQFNSASIDLDADAGDLGAGQYVSTHNVVGVLTQGVFKRAAHYDAPLLLQPGLESYNPNGFNGAWGNSTAIRVDPVEESTFWGIGAFANTGDRWTSHIAKMKPFDLAPYIEADNNDNSIVITPRAENVNLFEVNIDGVTTDIIPYDILGTVTIMGHAGADHFLIDYTLGDPITSGGVVLDGGFGTDTIETNDPNGAEFVMNVYDHPTYGDSYPARLFPFIALDRDVPVMDDFALQAPDGTYNTISEIIDVEELIGGGGNDLFRFEEGLLLGSALGQGGDDTFQFAGMIIGDLDGDGLPEWTGAVGESINGGTGFNTLEFTDMAQSAIVQVLGSSEFEGFDGRTISLTATTFHALGGPIGGDNVTDQWRHISYVRGSDNLNDQFFGMDLESTFTVDDENSRYEADGTSMGFFHWENMFGSSLSDNFNVLSNTLDPIFLNGQDGNDHYVFSSDAPDYMGTTDNIGGLIFALGGAGENTLMASNFGGFETSVLVLAQRISGMGEIVYNAVGGTFDLTIFTSQFDDFIQLHSFDRDNTLVFRSFHGDDRFSIEDLSKASVKIYGGEGDDVYVIERIQDVDFRNLEIFDSIGRESDRVTLAGTILDELWIIDSQTFEDLDVAYEGIEVFGIEGRGGDDVFHIRESIFELFIDGGDGNDIFNISSDADVNLGTTALLEQSLHIEGGTGTNALNISNFAGLGKIVTIDADTITGLLPMPLTYLATDGNFAAISSELSGIRLDGSDTGYDYFGVDELLPDNDLSINSHGGNDRFTVRATALGDVDLAGGAGSDIYHVYFVGSGDRQMSINDVGASDFNRVEFYGNNEDETIEVSNVFVERFSETVFMGGDFVFLSVDSWGGNDTLTLANSVARTNYLRAGTGDDIVEINGTDGIRGIQVFGSYGDDTFHLLETNGLTFTRVQGESGDDVFNISQFVAGRVNADGGDGSDLYTVNMVGDGNRLVNTRDTGTFGFDTTIVNGTTGNDDMELRGTRIFSGDEKVAYDGATERLELHMGEGNDYLNMLYSRAHETLITTHFGSDEVYVASTGPTSTLDFDLGSGDDTITFNSTKVTTTTTVLGQEGDDQFNIGTGKLGRMRGPIHLNGGENSFGGEDAVVLNDSGTTGNIRYFTSWYGTRWNPAVQTDEGPLFAGITTDASIDSIRIDATEGKNNFVVDPSLNTKFFLNGNGDVADSINLIRATETGANLNVTDEAFGEGFWDFTDGSQLVEFDGVEFRYQ